MSIHQFASTNDANIPAFMNYSRDINSANVTDSENESLKESQVEASVLRESVERDVVNATPAYLINDRLLVNEKETTRVNKSVVHNNVDSTKQKLINLYPHVFDNKLDYYGMLYIYLK